MGFVVGGALALSGVLLQGMFRNALVEPYTLGISGGASLGVCLGVVAGLGRGFAIIPLGFMGFAGAFGAILLIYFLNIRGGRINIQGLLLGGVMFSFICSSLVMLIMSVARTEDLHGIIFWIMGSLEEPRWAIIKITALVSLAGLLAAYIFARDLNALALGEDEAQHLGVNVERVKKCLFFIAAILTGVSVAGAGIIGFVGLAVPHFVRLRLGSDHRIILIASYLAGGAFLVLCDTLARTIISPVELPVGVITGIVGGTLFVAALMRTSRE
jgi:iron complex transport system permease protein